MIVLASTLPEHSNDGYVAAAYIVFFALILIYVTIMSIRLTRVERKVRELSAQEREHPQDTHKERTLKGATHDGQHPEGRKQAGEVV